MGIFDRLSDVIRSYLNDVSLESSGRPSPGSRRSDPDLEAAYDELNDFLGGGKRRFDPRGASPEEKGAGKDGGRAAPPEILRGDFAELDLEFGASPELCKTAYKKLLKLHHPDRHAGHEGNMKKATAKSARINAAYDRIERWRETGKAE
ncbi:MAG: J domain-containing protein [Treponema sp.]|nr:J domain-containing protein [Treponema sp.]